MAHTSKDFEKLDREMDYEEKNLPAKVIATWVAGLLVGLLLLIGLMYLIVGVPQTVPRPDVVMNRKMLAPTLQSNPPAALRKFKAAQAEHMSSYGWVDKGQGVVHIPIDVAMDLAIQKGLFPRQAEGKK